MIDCPTITQRVYVLGDASYLPFSLTERKFTDRRLTLWYPGADYILRYWYPRFVWWYHCWSWYKIALGPKLLAVGLYEDLALTSFLNFQEMKHTKLLPSKPQAELGEACARRLSKYHVLIRTRVTQSGSTCALVISQPQLYECELKTSFSENGDTVLQASSVYGFFQARAPSSNACSLWPKILIWGIILVGMRRSVCFVYLY